jgi:methionine-rich copper-binding protein CopC
MSLAPPTLLVLSAAFALIAGSAQAHAHLVSAVPAPGAEVKSAPTQLDLHFSEGVLAALSGAAVKDAAGHAVALGPASIAANDRKRMVLPIKAPLSSGVYTVSWRAVAADTHRSAGQYSFTVR